MCAPLFIKLKKKCDPDNAGIKKEFIVLSNICQNLNFIIFIRFKKKIALISIMYYQHPFQKTKVNL